MSNSIAVIGECMLELRPANGAASSSAKPMMMAYGGDTLNTSVYLAREGVSVCYVTGLGDDPNSQWLIDEWQREGINCSLIDQQANSVPGMYLIETDELGERSFYYWRKGSPASKLFDDQQKVNSLFEQLSKFDYLYVSGISLAILPQASLARLFESLRSYREAGGKIVFDGNYRPTLWKDKSVAQTAYKNMYQITNIALPTLEDEEMLFGFSSAEQVVESITAHGVEEVVVKMGDEGCLSNNNNNNEYVAARPTTAIDTTAAGDSFNAGYLAARFANDDCVSACKAGHALASQVIQHKGAIIPRR